MPKTQSIGQVLLNSNSLAKRDIMRIIMIMLEKFSRTPLLLNEGRSFPHHFGLFTLVVPTGKVAVNEEQRLGNTLLLTAKYGKLEC